jgi:hypothetical protein
MRYTGVARTDRITEASSHGIPRFEHSAQAETLDMHIRPSAVLASVGDRA